MVQISHLCTTTGKTIALTMQTFVSKVMSLLFNTPSAAAAAAKLLQLCLTLCNTMNCSLPGSSVHGIPQARILKCSSSLLLGIFPTQGLNPGFLHCRWILNHLSHQGSPTMTSLDSKQIKKQRHHFANKGLHSQSYGFFSSPMRCGSWTTKKGECKRIDTFKLCFCRRLLRIPLTARRSNHQY